MSLINKTVTMTGKSTWIRSDIMKKTLSIILAASLVCGGLTACSSGNSKESTSAQISELRSYKAASIGMADDFSEITGISKNCGGNVLIFGELCSGGWSGYVTNSKFNEYSEFRFTPQENETVQGAALLSGEKKAVLTLLGGETFIYVYNSNNNLEKTLNCGEILDENSNVKARLYNNGDDGFFINVRNDEVFAVSPDGHLIGELKCGSTISGVANNSENELNVLLTDFKELTVNSVDAQSLSVTEKVSYEAGSSSGYAVGAGAGDYKLIYLDNGAIFGLSDTDKVRLVNFTDLEFHEYEVQDIIMLSDGSIAVLIYSGEMYLLTEQDISELKSKEVITMATWSENGMYDEEVKYFNSHNDDYKIEYRTLEGNYFDEQLANLRLQVLSGDAPDIIPQITALNVDSLNTAVFTDLYEFIDNDSELSRDDFLPNVRKGMERDGRMIMISPTFSFHTVTAKGYPGVRENWSIDDFIYAYENKPENKEIFRFIDSTCRSAIFDFVVKTPFFIDYENAECHFDSPEFIKVLNFFNDKKIGLSMTEYDNLSGDQFYDMIPFPIKDGNLFVDFEAFDIQWFGSFLDQKRNEYENDYVLAGYPFDGKRSGSYISLDECCAIMEKSAHKEGAWQFLRMMLTDDYSTKVNTQKYLSFPVLKKRFDELADFTMQEGYTYFAFDENYKIIPDKFEKVEWRYYDWDEENKKMIDMGKMEPFTQEEFDYYYNVVTNAEVLRYDNEVGSIVNEETWKFFDYECTAEECAKMIQNRVSLYLSERYG